MPNTWGEAAARYLRSTSSCPRCERPLGGSSHCPSCGAVLTGPVADELHAASLAAADAIDRRQALIARLEIAPVRASLPAPSGAPISTDPRAVLPTRPAADAASGRISLQSVLAVAGAGLFAVAAIVFTYFNDDLTDVGTRRAIIAVVTVLFLGGAFLLARRRLQLSAEAVGALGMVFLALDVAAVADAAPAGVDEWVFAAVGSGIAGVLMLVIGAVVRLRTWVWTGALGLVLVPVLLGFGVRGDWSPAVGFAGAAAVSLALHEVLDRIDGRFDSRMVADHVSLVVERILALAFALGLLLPLALRDVAGSAVPTSLVLIALAIVAGLGVRRPAAMFWAIAAGVLGVAATAVAPLAVDPSEWVLAALLIGAAAGVAIAGLVPWPAPMPRAMLWLGALLPFGAIGVAAVGPTVFAVFGTILRGDRQDGLWSVDPATALSPAIGLAAATLGLVALAIGMRRSGHPWTPAGGAAGWVATAAVLAFASWPESFRGGQVALALGIAVLAAVALRLPGLGGRIPGAIRAPLSTMSHALIVFAAVVSWFDDGVTVLAGAAVVAAIAVIGGAAAPILRPAYVVVGYAYALVVLARALDLAGLETIPVISLTSTVASLAAVAATLVPRIRPATWSGILVVTGVPFLLGIATVLQERTWWTAIASAAIFVLAITLTLSRRPGITVVVRAIAAGLLVPSLSVVVVNVGPQLLETSGSPVTLPIIAAIVAIVLPLSAFIASWLTRGGVRDATIAAVRIAIEASAFTTVAIAIVLALALPASGLDTALVVLVLLAVGSAATSVVAGRRYGWWVAGASLTGALWCVWGLIGVTDVEPFVFPPALAVAAVGVVLTLLGRRGAPLVGVGLAVAVATTLTLLAVGGNGADAALPWRALGLLAAGTALAGIGGWVAPSGRAGAVRTPVLAVAIAAAAGGALQGIRTGRGLEPVAVEPVWVALSWSAAAAVIASVAAVLLAASAEGRSWRRWLLVPAVVFLVAGPIAATGSGTAAMWTLWGLTLALLGSLVVITSRSLRGPTMLPPVAAVFAIAWVTAVAGWSARDLHVEWWSLPLGAGLLTAGVLVLRRDAGASSRSLVSWPVGFSGSWWLLAPGIVVTLLPSVLATGTNPATWRAVLVIALALAALLIGSLRRLAAPFVLALGALAAEIAVVFIVQIGRDIDALLWWITLATAGAVLLVIAVGFERRTGGDQGLAARMRDLR